MTAAALGNAPLGSTPFGLGTTASARVPPLRRILAPHIDPVTKDAVVSTDDELEATPVNRQRVLLTCMTELGSSAALTQWGVKMPRKITDGFAAAATTELHRALRFMVADGSIAIDRIDVEELQTGRWQFTVHYEDRQVGGEDRAVFYG